MRAVSGWLVLVLLSCSRTGFELDASPADGDRDTGVGRGGSAPHGDDSGIGAASTGGSAGARGGAPNAGMAGSPGPSEPPFDPGGPVPDCRVVPPVFVPVKDRRWLALEASRSRTAPSTLSLIELTPDGPNSLNVIADDVQNTELPGWSSDGRFFAFQHSRNPVVVEVFEVAPGSEPIRLRARQYSGIVRWSPVGSQYHVVPSASSSDRKTVTVVTVATGAERGVEIPEGLEHETWSPDGRFLAFAGAQGVVLVDTTLDELSAERIHLADSARPVFSPDGRYLAFDSTHVSVYDTQEAALEVHDALSFLGTSRTRWLRNDWLAWMEFDALPVFLDVTQKPLTTVSFGSINGVVSPGAKCMVYLDDHCIGGTAPGICVDTLPPGPESKTISIGYSNETGQLWAGTGDRLIARHPEPLLFHITFDGGDLRRERITREIDALTGARWNPSGRSDWIFYAATTSADAFLHPRLWHRETGRTLSLDVAVGAYQEGDWSPDGRNLVIQTEAEGLTTVYVQELLDAELGRSWSIFEGDAALAWWEFRWQP